MADIRSTSSPESWRPRTAHLIGIGAAVAALLAPWLLNGDLIIVSPTDLGTDMIAKQWPNAMYIVQNWRTSGELPLWRTTALGGVPIVGNPSMLLMYPPYWLIFVFSISRALTLFLVLHLTWAGWGAYVLARRVLLVSPSAGLVSALSFTLSAKMIAHMGGGHLDILAAVAWLPWLWWATDGLVRRVTWSALLVVAVAVAAQAVTHLPTLWLSSWVVGSWGLLFGLTSGRRRTRRGWVRFGLGTLCALAIAMGLSAPHLGPMWELLKYSTRGGMTLTEASRFALPAPLLIGMILPSALAFPEWVIYPGAVTLSLAPISWLEGKRRGRWWFLVALVSLGIVFSLGRATPAYTLLFRLLPGMDWFRIPTRMMFFVQLAVALLAGMGWDAAERTQLRRKKALMVWGLVLTMLLVIGVAWTRLFPGVLAVPILSAAAAAAALLVLVGQFQVPAVQPCAPLMLAALVVLEAAALAPQFIAPAKASELVTPTDEVKFLTSQPGRFRTYSAQGIVSLTEAVAHGIETADGNDPFQLEHYIEWISAASGCDLGSYAVRVPACTSNQVASQTDLRAHPNETLLALGNVRYVIADHPLPEWESKVWHSGDVRIYENPEVLPRAFVVPEVVAENDDSAALDLLAENGPRGMATIETTEEERPTGHSAYKPATMLQRTPNGARIRAQGPGWLVFSETWAPGWQASVDGIKTEVYRTDVAFCGVPLPAGSHTVSFKYAPSSWVWGRGVSLATGLIAVGGTVIAFWRRRRESART